MKLYRFLCEKELKLILEGDVSQLGGRFDGLGFSNTHRYKKNERYLHFYFNKADCDYIRKVHENEAGSTINYVVEFNVPLKKIIGHIGRGFYHSNQDWFNSIDTIYELALPTTIFDPTWLVGYEKVPLVNETKTEENQSEKI